MTTTLIIAILLLIVIFIVLYIKRNGHKNEIDRLEDMKIQVESKPVMEELERVNRLNMTGQTEELTARWRSMWTEVKEVHVPSINSKLMSADEASDKFQFGKARQLETDAANEIGKIEGQMKQILAELEDLVDSESRNRSEMETLVAQHKQARKALLAHQHSFGNAAEPLERRLEAFLPLFDEYEQLSANGNYLQAREIVADLSKEANLIFPLIQEIPALLTELNSRIPASIKEIRSGQHEMELKSYFLGHLELDRELDQMEDELENLKMDIRSLNTEVINQRVNAVKEKLESFYELLEKEVEAKKYVDEHIIATGEVLEVVARKTRETLDEYITIRQSYKIPEKQQKVPHDCRLRAEHLQERYNVLIQQYSEDQCAFSALEEELSGIRSELDEINKIQSDFVQFMKNLRIDETAARKKVEELKNLLISTDRTLHKANIPGVPEEMDVRLEEAEERLFVALKSLSEVPLNIQQVETDVNIAENVISDTRKNAIEMIENVQLIEQIIQYGNRYRKTDPKMNARLLEAEESFRQMRYTKALEEAATAVEAHEPGAMKRIEVLAKQDV